MAVRERVSDWSRWSILGLVLLLLGFAPLALGAVRAAEWVIVVALAVGAGAIALGRVWLFPRSRLLWPPVCWVVLAVLGYAAIRYAQADLEYVARQEVARIGVYALVFLLVLNHGSGQKTAALLAHTLVFLALGIAAYGIYQFATGHESVWHFIRPPDYAGRGSGTYICPNHFAGFLAMVLPLGLASAVASRMGVVQRILLGYASLVILGGIAVSLSRGGWIATGVTLAAFFLWWMRRSRWRFVVLVLALGISLGLYGFYQRSVEARKRLERAVEPGTRDNLSYRWDLAGCTVRMWRDHPWFGVGPAHFDYRFPAYRTERTQGRPGRAHNDYLNTLADWGVVGAGLIAAGLVTLGLGLRQTWKYVDRSGAGLENRGGNRSALVVGSALGLLACLVHAAFDFNLHIPANALVATTLAALLAGHIRYTTERFWWKPGLLGAVLVTPLVGGLLGWLAVVGLQAARENTRLAPAADAQSRMLRSESARLKAASDTARQEAARAVYRDWEQRVSWLEQAAKVEPANFETRYELGEAIRTGHWGRPAGQTNWVTAAIDWFGQAARLNPYDPYPPMRTGMCLDWLGQHAEAGREFEKALALDGNDFNLWALQGWHFVQAGDPVAARRALEESLRIRWWDNWIASAYLRLLDEREAAAEKP